MANVYLQLEEQAIDQRSCEIAYRFTAENRGQKAVSLRPPTPRLPEGAELLDVKKTDERIAGHRHAELCLELSRLLESHIQTQQKQPFRLREWLSVVSPTIARRGFSNDPAALQFEIEGVQDCEYALATWFKAPSAEADVTAAALFQAKLAQLRRYEQLADGAGADAAFTQLAPGSVFSATYLCRFARGKLDPRRYTLTIETALTEADSAIVETNVVSASTTISPPAWRLSVVAVLSSFLGVVLKAALASSADDTAEPYAAINLVARLGGQLLLELISLQAIGAAILALVVFNVYEHTEFNNQMRIGVGWRSALLVGVLCGLFAKQALGALAGFLGQ